MIMSDHLHDLVQRRLPQLFRLLCPRLLLEHLFSISVLALGCRSVAAYRLRLAALIALLDFDVVELARFLHLKVPSLSLIVNLNLHF